MEQPLQHIPIPVNRSVDGWKAAIIEENGEPAVLLNYYAPKHVITNSQYFAKHIHGAQANMYCRSGVAERLLKAAHLLPAGYQLLIWDAWRPIAVQQALFDQQKNYLQQENPQLSDEDLTELAQKYVSIPSDHHLRPSPHLTGGAIDLTVIDASGHELNMGTPFDYFGAEAQTDFYELKPDLSAAETVILHNRRLLYNAMISAGFSNYPHEWWHFDYGNQFWSKLTGNKALYNKILL